MKILLKSIFRPETAISLIPVIMGIWFPFAHLFLLNASNLTLPLSVHLPILSIISIAGFTMGQVLQLLIPFRFRRVVSYILLLLGVFFWAENTLLIGDFGFLLGDDLDWGKNQHLLYFELLLGAILAFLVFKFKHRLIQKAWWVFLLLLISSVANIVPAFQGEMSRTKSTAQHTFTLDHVFSVSKKQNVLLFIVDTFQADIFSSLIVDNPAWRDVFDGFTFFPNATSAFPRTYPSIPNILTGEAFDNSLPFVAFNENAYLKNSAPKVLKDNGFDVRYRSFVWKPYFAHPDVADNLAGSKSSSGRKWMQQQELSKLSGLVLFRLAPFVFKPWFYNDNQFRISGSFKPVENIETPYILKENERKYSQGNNSFDLEFLDQITTFLKADSPDPTFRIFHLEGIHAELELDDSLNFIGIQPVNPETYMNQAVSELKLLSQTLAKLKQEGVYDNSLILIVGDHGGGVYDKISILHDTAQQLGFSNKYETTADQLPPGIIKGAIPLILAKPISSNGPLEISTAPVELGDIPGTIFTELGFEIPGSAPSIFDIPDTEDRVRFHRHYIFDGWDLDFITPMNEYQIDGFSWDPASWSATGRNLNSNAIEAHPGRLIILDGSGNMDDFAHNGWSEPLARGRRITGRQATITIPYENISSSMVLELDIRSSDAQKMAVPLKIFVNDQPVGTWTLANSIVQKTTVFLPEKACQDQSSFEIRFELDDNAGSESQFFMIGVVDHPGREKYQLGDEILFATHGNSDPYITYGWTPHEPWGIWTGGFGSMMSFQLDSPAGQDLAVQTSFNSALFPNSAPVEVDVVANGETVAHWVLNKKKYEDKTIRIPGHLIQRSQVLDLTFLINNPRRLRDYGDATDPRFLGMAFKNLVIREAQASTSVDSLFQSREILFGDKAGVVSYGLHKPEKWKCGPVVWTDGAAGFSVDLSGYTKPASLQLGVQFAPINNSYLVASANGQVLGAGYINKFPWNGCFDLRDVTIDSRLNLTIFSTTRQPSLDNPEKKDSRLLGLALSSLILENTTLPEIRTNKQVAVLDIPDYLDLTPGKQKEITWSGVYPSETWDGSSVAWTNGHATCTISRETTTQPEFLLVDIAGTGHSTTQLQIEINGISVLSTTTIGANWKRMIDISHLENTSHLTISLRSGSFVPANIVEGSKDQRALGFALRQMVLVQ